jgi:hypothetical protein
MFTADPPPRRHCHRLPAAAAAELESTHWQRVSMQRVEACLVVVGMRDGQVTDGDCDNHLEQCATRRSVT